MQNPRSAALKALKRLHRQSVGGGDVPNVLFRPDTYIGRATQDRAIVLVATSILEQCLEKALLTRLIPLDTDNYSQLFGSDRDAPLSTLSAKIRIGFALGIFEKRFREDLDMIRHLRNAFAHVHAHVDFDTPEVAATCRELHYGKTWRVGMGFSSPDTPKEMFRLTAMSHSMCLYAISSDRDSHQFALPDAEVFVEPAP